MTSTVLYPFGILDTQIPTVTENEEASPTTYHFNVDVKDNATLLNLPELEQDTELVLTANEFLNTGAVVIVKATNGEGNTYDLTLDSDTVEGATIDGVDEKTKYSYFFYNGSKFIQLSTNQVD